MKKYYSGIGSRTTPTTTLSVMVQLGRILALKEYTLRSGAASGADSAFEEGCNAKNGSKEIFLPWKNFNGHPSQLYNPTPEAFALAKTVHPVYDRLLPKARFLIARNMHQILGHDLNTPVDFVICWTKDGCERESEYGINTGGTGSAITLASRNNIPVFNLYRDSSYSYLINMVI